MHKKMTVKANAKINLILDVTGTLKNGYHSIFTIMQSIDLYDTVSASLNETGEINLLCSKPIPCDERNTAYKAAQLFFSKTGIKYGADIEIEKEIPVSAGLAGGSTNAAAVLALLNVMTGKNLSVAELCSIGAEIGADVPFCLVGGTALCQDIGSVISVLPDLPECFIVLAKPPQGVSTKKAYAEFDRAPWIRRPKNELMLNAAVRQDLKEIALYCANVFEQVIDIPKRVDIKHIMREAGALASCMSGSGSTIFGIFDNKDKAKKCALLLKQVVPDVFITTPQKNGIVFE
ncbi:MAG TPA: 4-(cytidine 5'-diphospho)-2-C-methyl-D-erythritol kinase [Oscillospiraceae bacterium]|nr:4-(cytidine 5'-diphospho)-2-C-methyl-D-erythritol kinase [Oscillospiraceae bacterium]